MSAIYVKTTKQLSYNSLLQKDFSLSSSLYKELEIPNQNVLTVRDFLSRPLTRKDLGNEIGSINYIDHSSHHFLRSQALQSHVFLPDITAESVLPIMPSSFVNMNLKKGDIIISKDSNIGEIAILERDYPNYMLSGALYRLPLKDKKYYLLAFIKHAIFREQLDILVPKGATIRHAKTLFLDCKIPMPNHNSDKTIKFIEVLTMAIINKEHIIKQRHKCILHKIETELLSNQKPIEFRYELPKVNEIEIVGRLDTNLYRRYFKYEVFKITNYKHEFESIRQSGFSLSRGQNLQVSNIGSSIYSTSKHNKFYTLMLPMFLSKYGTINKLEYLGNENSLKTLDKGDIIFGAEGFEKGRSVVVIEEQDRVITNIHGITIKQDKHTVNKAIFIKCFLDYLREKGLIDLYAVGGNGGSLAQKYWEVIPFPKFDDIQQNEITLLYHNPGCVYDSDTFTLDNFLEKDNAFNDKAGIYELDKTAKQLRRILDKAIDDIANDREVDISFKQN